MENTRPELSIILPCYNEAKNIPLFIEEFRKAAPAYPFELICVENGSTDNSREVLTRILQQPQYAFARMVVVEKNQGYGFGIMSGLYAATGEFLAWSHADLQCSPKDVFAACEKLKTSANPARTLVKGKRINRPFNQLPLTLGMQILATLILGKLLTDINAQPKVFPKTLLEKLTNPPKDFSLDLYLLYVARAHDFKIATIPVIFADRLHGASNWNFGFLARYQSILKALQYMLKLRFRNHFFSFRLS
ncbi:MAG: glycosyltransferase family 2 protein [Candidatus Schekmanbacteria bacterium]|nr:glycosyltransferase family 2 protein [Candidatus Schekmanbacteria bacterium]